ncbi:hypothetical protein MKK67_00955 [Methylobacterium sp. J-072]|uniref:hypothetical protein n=1 Tax=Methylobacterium sp. J-072 TaxID=2836651 RepID=UPI001FBB5EF6|nr:hypothetical protein [Methylobacterium sp. J-072]MCJ2091084.1 hypothetical protein [Methylobacterium sp. J-072]
MQPNLLNPVLFTVLGDAVTLAKLLSSTGLALDVLGVVILLVQDLRMRTHELDEASIENQIRRDMQRRIGMRSIGEVPVSLGGKLIAAGAARRLQAVALLRGTRTGFALILAGFILQLSGTLAS